MPVAEPQVPWPLRAAGQLRQRLQDGGLPRRQVPRLPPPLLLHHALPGVICIIEPGDRIYRRCRPPVRAFLLILLPPLAGVE